MPAPNKEFLTATEAHLQLATQLLEHDQLISLPAFLDVQGDPRFESLQPIPDHTIREKVLFWMIDRILVPDNPELTLEDPRVLGKTIAKMLTYISMNDMLHGLPDDPRVDLPPLTPEYFDRALLTSKLYGLLFWYDNNFGNEQQASLSADDKVAFITSLARMRRFLRKGIRKDTPSDHADRTVSVKIRELHRAELALIELVTEIETHLPPTDDADDWFGEFRQRLVSHLRLGNADLEAKEFGITEYLEFRRDSSGMNVAGLMSEFNYERYLPRAMQRSPQFEVEHPELKNLFTAVRTLERSYQDYGGNLNDLLSAPKEMVDEGSRVNLVAVVYYELLRRLGEKEEPLDEVELYARSVEHVGQLLVDIKNFFFFLREGNYKHQGLDGYLGSLRESGTLTKAEYLAFKTVFLDMEVGVRAAYLWQLTHGFPRYQHEWSLHPQTQPDEQYFWQMLADLGVTESLLARVFTALAQPA